MEITYTVLGPKEELILFLDVIHHIIPVEDIISFHRCFLKDTDLNEEGTNDTQDMYAIKFSTKGSSTTKEIAELAATDLIVAYAFKIPNCSLESRAIKNKGTSKYSRMKEEDNLYNKYNLLYIDEEEFYNKDFVLHKLDEFEDLETYERRYV